LKLNEELNAYKNRLDGSEQQKANIRRELVQSVSSLYFRQIVSSALSSVAAFVSLFVVYGSGVCFLKFYLL